MKISTLAGALESGWAAIAAQYPDLPDTVIVVGTRAGVYGHFAHRRWVPRDGNGDARHEVMIEANGLQRGGRLVFETLLHEAVHALAEARGIKDTSRGGRYHNARFKDLAESMGLVTERHGSIGCITPDVTDATAERYAGAIAAIDEAIQSYRAGTGLPGLLLVGGADPEDPPEKPDRPRVARCDCGRRIMVTDAELVADAIECKRCGSYFDRPAQKVALDPPGAEGGD